MASNYPTDYDAFTNPTSSDNLSDPAHADQHADINDAMEAVQATLGLVPDLGRGTVQAFNAELLTRMEEDQDVTTLAYAASVALDFAIDVDAVDTDLRRRRVITLAGNLTLTTTNLTAGRCIEVFIFGDGSIRTLTLPAWRFIGAASPANIAANKVGRLRLFSKGTTDADVVAEWVVQA